MIILVFILFAFVIVNIQDKRSFASNTLAAGQDSPESRDAAQ